MAKGPRDTTSLVMHTGWDAAELVKFQTADGATIDQVAADMEAALGALNAEIYSDPFFASLVSYTDQPELEYRSGSSNGFQDHTEYSSPDAARAALTGHLLPLKPKDRGLGWTWDYLRNARQAQLDADLADALKDARDLYRVRILTRCLKRGDDAVGSGYSPGFATTAASTSVDFTPPAYGGTAFANTHEHYVAIAGGVFTNAVFEDAFDELREHGHLPPFTFLIGPSDRAAVTVLSKFTKAPSQGVKAGLTQDVATPNQTIVGSQWAAYLGTIEEFEVYEVRGVPQYYGFGYKSYGPNSQRNPLRIRLGKGKTRPQVIMMPSPNNSNAAHPLQYMMLFDELGVGVYDRTAGTARYTNNATWADGSPT